MYVNQLVLYPDIGRCLGCKTCEIACAIEHSKGKDLFSAFAEGVKSFMDVVYAEYPVPMNCRHCEDAPCLNICPTEAITRWEEGEVVVDTSRCIGCKSCAVVCPFGAIRFERVASKCDLCSERLSRGSIPACVEACPVNALRFEVVEEKSKRDRIAAAKRLVQAREEESKIEGEKMTTDSFKDFIWIGG